MPRTDNELKDLVMEQFSAMKFLCSERFVEMWLARESLARAPVCTANWSKINALELFSWLKAVLTPVNNVSTSKVLEVSKEHAQRKPQAAYCRGFSRGVKKPNTQQTSHAKVFVNAKSHATGAPNENIVQNHLHISIVKRIIVFKR